MSSNKSKTVYTGQDTKSATPGLKFLDQYRNIIIGIAGVIVLIGVGYFVYNSFFIKPKNKEAIDQMFQAQVMYDQDSFQLALNNPGIGKQGFLKIIENYGGTESANLANYYAGISYLNLGDYDNAIKYLSAYKPKGDITPAMANVALGDAYAEKNDDNNALKYYERGVAAANNELTGPYALRRLGLYQEKLGKWSEAERTFKKIMDQYGATTNAIEIEAYYERAKLMAQRK